MKASPHLAQALEAARHLSDDEPPWDALLDCARRVVGGDSASFIVVDPVGGLITTRQHHVDPKAEHEYVQHFHMHDIGTIRTRDAAQGTWFDTARISVHGLTRGERDYLDYMHRHRMLQMVGLVAIRVPELYGGFTIQRCGVRATGPDWALRPDIRKLSHAVQAGLADLHRKRQDWIDRAQGALECFEEALCLLAADGRVLHATAQAQALLCGECELRIDQHLLQHTCKARLRELLAAVHAAAHQRRAGSLPLQHASGRVWGRADLAPAPAWVGLGGHRPVLMRLRPAPTLDPMELQDPWAAAFGLTAAEARVLASLAMGQSIAEHAQRRGRSVHTVRKQVAVLMQKMGCTRQAELVQKALRFTA